MMKVKIFKKSEAIMPCRQTELSAGYDLYACLDKSCCIEANGGRALIPTGIYLQLPEGFEAQIRPRSGLAYKNGVTVLNSPGTIDADYRGEVGVVLINHGNEPFIVSHGDRIAQMIIAKFETVNFEFVEDINDLSATDRGSGGFGHTGK